MGSSFRRNGFTVAGEIRVVMSTGKRNHPRSIPHLAIVCCCLFGLEHFATKKTPRGLLCSFNVEEMQIAWATLATQHRRRRRRRRHNLLSLARHASVPI
ncbi:hypothetical protein BS78_06G040900 [Paspalum vaginatum]|nr:hypothetical protein BS78_06G040900 [Paspalum vaginatum]